MATNAAVTTDMPNNEEKEATVVQPEGPVNGSSGWLPAVDEPLAADTKRSTSHGSVAGADLKRFGSRKSLFTDAEGQAVAGSTFISGAGTTGPLSITEKDATLHERSASADAALTPKQKAKAAKAEAKENKRLSRVIREEAKAEKFALNTAIKELAGLQKIQATAVKNEAKANAAHQKVLRRFQKEESIFLAARSKFEAAQAQLTSEEETVEIVRNHAKVATEHLQEKSREVDGLRTMFTLDEKERAVKLNELKAKGVDDGCVIS